MTDWWDDFSNNLATDLTPLIALFGESPTKQYLSECLSFTDILIFSTAPIGIITAVVSAIRVCGSPSLRAFIGRAQEGRGNAEAELCSSTSRDVCELYNNGGIARVFGRPKLLEVVFDHQPEVADFYKSSNGAPESAGIYSFSEYMSLLKEREHLQHTREEKGGKGSNNRVEDSIAAGVISQSNKPPGTNERKNGMKYGDWEECTSRKYWDIESSSKRDSKLGEKDFAPNPNLSLNVGIKKRSQGWFIAAAVFAITLQSAVLIWAAVARYKLRFVKNDPTDKYAIPMTIIGTIFLSLGVGLCAFLIENSTDERVFRRKRPQSHMYWVQPGNQYVGDQAFDSFVYSDRSEPLTTYISSTKKPDPGTQQWRNSNMTKLDNDSMQARLVWTAGILATLGFIIQFLGLRACHSSVPVAQLGAMLIMSVIRALLRTQRMKREDNCMFDRPDAYVGYELDWLALHMDSRDEISTPLNHEKTNDELDWKLPSPESCAWSDEKELPQVPSPELDTTPNGILKPDVQEGILVGFVSDCDTSREWLKGAYASGSDQDQKSLPHEWARRFLYRSRLARMTNDWNDDHVATRNVARRLAQAISETADVLTFNSTVKNEWRDIKAFYWPIRTRLSRASHSSGHNSTNDSRHGIFYIALKRTHSDIRSAWTVDESELEAVLGLWAWGLREQTSRADCEHPETIRIISTKPSDTHDLNLWREPGGTAITTESLSRVPRRVLLCGLHNSFSRPTVDDPLQTLKVKGTIPEVCAQELYSLFLLSMLKATVEDIGGTTTVREGFGDLLLTNTTISSIQQAFTKYRLGSIDDAFACTIPILISSAKISSILGTLADVRKVAEQHIKAKNWDDAERLLRWALEQCHQSRNPSDPDLAFDFENHQRLLILSMCECYRKSLLIQGSSGFGIQGFVNLMETEFLKTYGEIRLRAGDYIYTSADSPSDSGSSKPDSVSNLEYSSDSDSSSDMNPVSSSNSASNSDSASNSSSYFSSEASSNPDSLLINHITLATTIKDYGMATLRLKKELSNQLGDVLRLESKLQPDYDALVNSTSPLRTMNDMEITEALNDAISREDLTETLFLISGIEILNRKIKLDNSLSRASEHGWYTVVRALMDLGADPGSRDDRDRTAFTYAALGGEFNILEHLLEKGFYPNFLDKRFRSPLFYASKKGFTRIVKRLLGDQRVSADPKDDIGRTPLWEAARGGHNTIVQLLLEHGAHVDPKSLNDYTALWKAIMRGHGAIVEMLLEKGAVLNEEDENDNFALYEASELGHEQVVKPLLEKVADVNAHGGDYGSALQVASARGHENVVKLLLDKGADVNTKGGAYGSALQVASGSGHEHLVRLMLEKGADINAEGGQYGNALQMASGGGHEHVVKLLLEKGADIYAKDGKYGSALQAASVSGYIQVMKILLDKGADVNAEGGDYGSALHAASAGGHKRAVKMLLEGGANINVHVKDKPSPLYNSSKRGYKRVVQLLLEEGADINVEGGHYGKALHAASARGHEQVVKLLLEKGADNYTEGGEFGSALHVASFKGHEQVVNMLLENGAEIDGADDQHGNALALASQAGHEQVVKLLLEKGADVNAESGYYGSALQNASVEGYWQLVVLLLKMGANVNAQSGYYGSALQGASAKGHMRVVRLLLEKGADVNVKGGEHGNALHAALKGGHRQVAMLLRNNGAV